MNNSHSYVAWKFLQLKESLEGVGFTIEANGDSISISMNIDDENMIFFNASTIHEADAFVQGMKSAFKMTKGQKNFFERYIDHRG